MANKSPKQENLKKFDTLPAEELKKITSKAGKKSGEKRREKKAWRDIANIMLSTPTSDKNKELLAKYNIVGEDADINAMIIYNLTSQALKGDLNAIRELKEITGNKAAEEIRINTVSEVADDIGEYVNASRKTKEHN